MNSSDAAIKKVNKLLMIVNDNFFGLLVSNEITVDFHIINKMI